MKRRRRGIKGEQTPGPELRPLRSRSLERWKSGLRNLIVRSTFLTKSKKSKLRLQLLAMAENDQWLRWRVLARDPGLVDAESQRQMQALDERNTERLKRILARHGWPTRHAVGESAAFAAWLIVQHSPELDFQKRCLILMRHAATMGQAAIRNVAYLEDRVLVREGRPQIYGTQLQRDRAEPLPIRDQDRVDERRHGVGLPPLSDYLADCRRLRDGRPAPGTQVG